MTKLGETVAVGLVGSALLLGAPAAAQDGATLFAQQCQICHGTQHPEDLVYNAAGNVAIIELVNAKGMGSAGSLADHTSIAAYLDTIKPTINMVPVPHDSTGKYISLRDVIVSAAEQHAFLQIITDVVTVSPPTKGTVTYTVANGFGAPTLVTYTPFPGQSGLDTWTYQGIGPEANTTVRTASVNIAADGTAPPPVGNTVAVEYYYADWNFYFITSLASEISALDGGAFGGVWKRTGETFNVWSDSTNGALPTHRFFSTGFSPKSSHFYTPYANEYDSLKAGTAWEYEGIAFYVQLPDAKGNCPAGTVVLYRLYNNGMGGAPNHRFTISQATFNTMQAAGWTFEGNGLTGAYACVPQ
jgi:hypothetical protein